MVIYVYMYVCVYVCETTSRVADNMTDLDAIKRNHSHPSTEPQVIDGQTDTSIYSTSTYYIQTTMYTNIQP